MTDDGCGFDTEKAPGMDEGHFGLGGVRERVRRHNGEMSIDAVKQHLAAICSKLGAANRAEAVDVAHRKHLLKS